MYFLKIIAMTSRSYEWISFVTAIVEETLIPNFEMNQYMEIEEKT